jgi:hypothetical protein
MLKILVDCGVELSCTYVQDKSDRRMMVKLRDGTAPLQIVKGSWQGVRWEERECKQCDNDEVANVCHWMVECDVTV